ncbi:hypothetical protein [Zeaxanthinibacter enoshimensis]|uniref:Uncharacterized protein n=1 Tax=Zeaxanthinibacter enoshimensis TaxID=392009 RepID=A0A4R6TLP8_9FLAO|nr:hypothetical protein [Zeaxanthinibacter enoshimensis]TDQ30728.1 hypothetical protein CLV82_1417 [Zeaxanthinibacter enoshimensis]
MLQRYLPLLFVFGCILTGSAQIKIGENPQNIHPASVLELESNDRALVITRVSTAEMNAIVPLQGAMVYNNDTSCIHFYNGSEWLNLCDALGLSFSTDPVVNPAETIVITETDGNRNFEVGQITGMNIVDFSIAGVDLQNNSITANKLAANSVGSEELQDNTVTDAEIDYNVVTLNDFLNDANFITGADIVSPDPNNAITDSGGAFFDATPLQNSITTNTNNLNNHIAADGDLDSSNELITGMQIQGNNLVINEGTNQSQVDLSPFTNTGTDSQTLSLNTGTNTLSISGGNQVNLSSLLDNTDNQNLIGASLNGANILQIDIEDGSSTTVDLSPLAGNGGNPNDELNTTFAVVGANLELTDNGGTLQVPLNQIDTDDQIANEVPVTAIPTNYAALTQDVEAHLEGIDAALAAGGGNPNDELNTTFAVVGANLELTDNGGTLQVPLNQIDTDDQIANEVPVTAIPTNYAALTQDVEAHLEGIDAALAAGGSGHSGTEGSIFFADNVTGNPTEDNTNLFWDNNLDRLGIGLNTPLTPLQVNGETRSEKFTAQAGSANLPSYSFSENIDFDTGMFRPSPDQLGFSTGGVEAIRINTVQDVGIGIFPTSNLHVPGSIATGARTASGNFSLGKSDFTIIITADSNITLPSAAAVDGRVYIIKNPQFTVNISDYTNAIGGTNNTINAGSSVWLQAIGGVWHQINN